MTPCYLGGWLATTPAAVEDRGTVAGLQPGFGLTPQDNLFVGFTRVQVDLVKRSLPR